MPMKRATGPPASSRATPRRSVERGRDDVDARVRIVDPVDGHLVDPQPAPLGEHEQLGVEEPAVVAHVVQQLASGVAAHGLEAALRVGEARAQHGVQQAVVGCARSARAWGRGRRARRAPAACRSRGRCGRTAAARRAAAGAQVGREVDVHVGDDVAPVAGRPRRAQRAPAALAVEAQDATPRSRRASARAIAGVASVLALSAITIRQLNGNAVVEEAVQAADAPLERGLLVVDRDDDVDVGRRRGRGEGELWHDPSIELGSSEPAGISLGGCWDRRAEVQPRASGQGRDVTPRPGHDQPARAGGPRSTRRRRGRSRPRPRRRGRRRSRPRSPGRGRRRRARARGRPRRARSARTARSGRSVGQSGAVVADREPDRAAAPPTRHLDRRPRGRVHERVAEQVGEHLAQLVGVAEHRRAGASTLQRDRRGRGRSRARRRRRRAASCGRSTGSRAAPAASRRGARA